MNSRRTSFPLAKYLNKPNPRVDLDTSSSICSSSCEEGEFRPQLWLDNTEAQPTQPKAKQISFSPSHNEEEVIVLSDDSEVNETQREIQERRWGMKSNYSLLKDNNRHHTKEENQKHKIESYTRQDKRHRHKRNDHKHEMHHQRYRQDTCKGKYTQHKTKRDKHTQHYKHKKYEHRKEQRNNDKPKFSPIKDDNRNEKTQNTGFASVNNKYDCYNEGRYYHKPSRWDSSRFEPKECITYYSRDNRTFEHKDRKGREHSKDRYYKHKHRRNHCDNNSVPDNYPPPPVQFYN